MAGPGSLESVPGLWGRPDALTAPRGRQEKSGLAPEVCREAAERMAQMLWRDADEDNAGGDGP